MNKPLLSLLIVSELLFSCTTEYEQESVILDRKSEPYRIEAGIVSTKTLYQPPYTVSWSTGDELSVFALKEGVYCNNRFVKSASGNDIFEEYEPSKNLYDESPLKVIYPYSEILTNFGEDGFTLEPVAIQTCGSQEVPGNGSHIDSPLYGSRSINEKKVKMHHLSTLFKVTVTNKNSEEIDISRISLKNSAGLSMTGNFRINPDSGKLLPQDDAICESSINITDGRIAPKDKGEFYLPSAPFILQSGDNIIIDVTAGDKTVSIKKTMAGTVNFAAGTVNKTSVDFISETQAKQLIFQFTNKGVNATEYSKAHDDERIVNIGWYIVKVDGVESVTYSEPYYKTLRFEAVDAITQYPVNWVNVGLRPGNNSIEFSCKANSSFEKRSAIVNVYFENTSEYVVTGTYKNNDKEFESITDKDPIFTFVIVQEGKPDDSQILLYDFAQKGINPMYNYECEIPSSMGEILPDNHGWYGCTLNGENVPDNDSVIGCYSDLKFVAYNESGLEINWIRGMVHSFGGVCNRFRFFYDQNTTGAPRKAVIRVFYIGQKNYTIQTKRYTSIDKFELLTLDNPMEQPVYELIVTQKN